MDSYEHEILRIMNEIMSNVLFLVTIKLPFFLLLLLFQCYIIMIIQL